MIDVFGEPYTSQSLLAGAWTLGDGRPPAYVSSREAGTSVWQHQFEDRGMVRGTMQQLVVPDEPACVCRLRLAERATFTIRLPEQYACHWAESDAGSRSARLTVVAPDTARILFYPAGERGFLLLRCWGTGFDGLRACSDGGAIDLGPGETYLAFAGSTSYPEADRAVERLLRTPYEEHLERRRAVDRSLIARLAGSPIRNAHPALDGGRRIRIERLAESVALLITAQQSADGGISAGYPFPLAYVRDQYGTCCGLLALGLHDEVRRNLEFRYRKWQRFGDLANAESMGHDRIRHVHENDHVELTAYTILEALDYAKAGGGEDSVVRLFPMLDWCLAAQVGHLRGGMLPFNGDETYVAGGFLPQSALNHGSFEATLLFIESARRLLAVARRHGLLSRERLEYFGVASSRAAASLRSNFLRGGVWVANSPERAILAEPPLHRHGVCEACGPAGWFGWTSRTSSGRYVCPGCAAKGSLPPEDPRAIVLYSAGLLPAFIRATELSNGEMWPAVRSASALFQERGYLPSREDGRGSVGYDAALLLYALSALRDPLAGAVRDHVLELADEAEAWSEYYEEKTPRGTRCRPWESGINIAAVQRSLSETGMLD